MGAASWGVVSTLGSGAQVGDCDADEESSVLVVGGSGIEHAAGGADVSMALYNCTCVAYLDPMRGVG